MRHFFSDLTAATLILTFNAAIVFGMPLEFDVSKFANTLFLVIGLYAVTIWIGTPVAKRVAKILTGVEPFKWTEGLNTAFSQRG